MRVRDPVCGKEIVLGDAVASADHDGWAYFFCSLECRDGFSSSPQRYSQRPAMAAARPPAGATGQSGRTR